MYAFVIDTFSRRIVDWSVAPVGPPRSCWAPWRWGCGNETGPATTAPGWCATRTRDRPVHELPAAAHLTGECIAASTGMVGDALDNALMESTTGLYKTEMINRRAPWRTLADIELDTAAWADWRNNRRLHGEIGHVPPIEFETEFYNTSISQ